MPWHKHISPIGMGQAIDHIKAEQVLVKPKASSALYPPAAAPVLLTHPSQTGAGPLRSGWAGALPAGKHTAALRAMPYVARLGLTHPLTAAAATVLSFGLSNRYSAQPSAPFGAAAKGPQSSWEHAFVPSADKPRVILDQYFGHDSALPTTTPGHPDRLPPNLRNSAPEGFAIDQASAEPPASGKPSSPIQSAPPQGYAPLTPAWWDSLHLSTAPSDPAYTKWLGQVADPNSIVAGQQVHALLDPRRWQHNTDTIINRALKQQPSFDPAHLDDQLKLSLKDGFLVYEFKPTVRAGDESTTIPLGDDALPGLAHHGFKSALDKKGLLRVLVHQADPQRFPQAGTRLGNEGHMLRGLLQHLASVHATPNALVLRAGELNADQARGELMAIKHLEGQLAKSHGPERARSYAQDRLADLSSAVAAAVNEGFRYDGSTDPEYFDYEFIVVLRKKP